jgi:hypothetical protein
MRTPPYRGGRFRRPGSADFRQAAWIEFSMSRYLTFGAIACGLAAMALLFGPEFSVSAIGMAWTPSMIAVTFGSILGLAALWMTRERAVAKLDRLSEGNVSGEWWLNVSLIAITFAGALVRIVHLGRYPLNSDEHLFVNSAHGGSLREVWGGIMEHLHPPANFFMLHYLQEISVDPLWLRAPALIAGIYVIWIGGHVARTLLGPTEGVAFAYLIAFSPGLIELSRVCRNYTPGFALMLTAFYFFARYLGDGRRRDLAWFSVFEALAVTWLYSLLLPFMAANLTLFGRMALQRKPWREWLAPIGYQVPVGLIMLTLYFGHIRIVSTNEMAALYALNVRDEIFQRPLDYALYFPLPLVLVFQYLLAGVGGLIFFVMAGVGAVELWTSRRREALALCLLTLGLAYAFRFAGLLPLSGFRHSSYVFPFAFGLSAASVPVFWRGFRGLRTGHAGTETRERATRRAGARLGPLGMMAVVVVFALFTILAFGTQQGVVFHTRQPQLPTTYDDLDQALELLEERAGPNDLILLSYQALMAYHAYLNREAMPYRPAEAASLDWGGRKLYYSPEAGWFFSPVSLVRAYYDVKRTEGITEIDRVWTLRGAGSPWEHSLRDWFDHRFPEVPKDDRLVIESRGWLFSVPSAELDRLVPQVAEVKRFYETDFTRAQFPPEARKAPEYFRR